MTQDGTGRRLAVLIDADNAPAAIVEGLFAEVARYGTAMVKRIYGDWTRSELKGWRDALIPHAIQPVQQFAYTKGKNATDSSLIIDAMDLLYSERFDGFCLVSSDSDFTPLASRIRQQGLVVYGFGEQKTPGAFVAACDKFVYTEILRVTDDDDVEAPAKRRSGGELAKDRKLVALLRSALDAGADEDGWAHLGAVGSRIAAQAPEFDSRNYGYGKLSDLFEALTRFEVRRSRLDGGQAVVQVREKPRKR